VYCPDRYISWATRRLLQAPEPNAALGEASDGVDQVPQGAAEAVELPDDQGVAGGS
jgi:hypothetical protein